jgi:O-antigen/teichoic acid export membrane protein
VRRTIPSSNDEHKHSMQTTISLKNLLTNGQYSFYSTLAEKSIFFIVFMYFARTFSIAEYGSIAVTFSFANILSSFFEFGFAPYMQREAASRTNTLEEQLNSILGFKIFTFILYALLTILYFYSVSSVTSLSLLIIATTVYIFGISGIFSRTLFGFNQYFQSFKATMLSKVIVFIVIGILILTKASSDLILFALLGGAILQTICLMRNFPLIGIHLHLGLKSHVLKNILLSSLPIGIGLSFVWIYDKVDVLLIQRLIGSEAVSYYAVAYSLYKIPQVAVGIIMIPFFTEISERYASEGSVGIRELYKPSFVILLISLMMILIYNCFPNLLLSLAYGKSYSNSGWILGMLSFALPGLLLNNLTGVTLNAIRKERKVMHSTFIALLLNGGFNVLLLPWIGVVGAIAATIIAEYSILCIQIYFLRTSHDITWRKKILPFREVV